MNTGFGTWNVRSLYRAGSLTIAASELAKCNLDLVEGTGIIYFDIL
jgi:hypothetical protein